VVRTGVDATRRRSVLARCPPRPSRRCSSRCRRVYPVQREGGSFRERENLKTNYVTVYYLTLEPLGSLLFSIDEKSKQKNLVLFSVFGKN